MCKHIFTPIAHRGGTEAACENTYEAFADAYALGYRWFETDVQISKDGFLYSFHDNNLKRIVGININIDQLNSEDLDQILIKGKHRIPRIDLLLRKFHDVTFNLDAKNIEASNTKETVPPCAIVPLVWQNSIGIYQSTLTVLFFVFSSVTHGSSFSCILAYLISEGSAIF